MKIFERIDEVWMDAIIVREGQVESETEEEGLIRNLPRGPLGAFDQITFDGGKIFGSSADG
jgi:hypothetical protein